MTRVFVDTNVLFPFSVMDVMLALTEDSVHEVLWTQALLAEWERVIVREQHRTAASAAAITSAIREYFADSEIPESAYTRLVAQMPGDDPDDRVHMAAAIAGGAEAIVTWNQADFPAVPLAARRIRVCAPDGYLCGLFDAWPDEVLGSIVRLAGEKRRPPMSPTDLTSLLAKAGVPDFADRLRARMDEQAQY
ncbi:PIN domain-containing protein [Micromonospora sp. NBC_01813]|uniref:PIN domain-containing protein n=1 Tax=Micromonospora sp. NBC_01813 TaxID=2975988 RepID=UPI002DDA0C30|nr:PIN domain-containing protein [Micromonospora sp. NBC_01813]WSA08913.1 PIN domain-containing protein [Micromonospora sp. NBC_01813]